VIRTARAWCAALLALGIAAQSAAAPDEDKLGKSLGYPIARIGNDKDWYYDESVRVGSFTHQAEIPGLYQGKANVLRRSGRPMPLARAAREPDYRWSVGQERDLRVDDFLARQRIMGLIVVKDGEIQVERYQYERTRAHRFVSHSMAKSITALAIGFALEEGRIASLDDRAERYAPKLRGTVYGETTIRNLLRMASGARYRQTDDGSGDTGPFNQAIWRDGIEAAAKYVKVRDTGQGARFHYASPHTSMLAAAVRGATGMSLSDYLAPRLWQAIGAEDDALWRADKTGLELAFGNFNATLRDYARLGVVLANDGARPDLPGAPRVIPREFLLEATDWRRAPEQFRPGKATPHYGYGYQFWIYPGQARRFALLGVYGQSIFVDPGLRLVVVQTAANATAAASGTSLGREREAFWRGVMRYYATR
jgi:CubicO group peptidase (beta-lactamase class C family)